MNIIQFTCYSILILLVAPPPTTDEGPPEFKRCA